MKIRPKTDLAGSQPRCSFCHDETGELETCAGCSTKIHLECRQEAGKCPTIGCAPPRDPGSARMRTAAEVARGEPPITGPIDFHTWSQTDRVIERVLSGFDPDNPSKSAWVGVLFRLAGAVLISLLLQWLARFQ